MWRMFCCPLKAVIIKPQNSMLSINLACPLVFNHKFGHYGGECSKQQAIIPAEFLLVVKTRDNIESLIYRAEENRDRTDIKI